MAYTISFSVDAEKSMKKFAKAGKASEIQKGLKSLLESPETRGKPLKENLKGRWSYKTGKIRILYTLDEAAQTITITKVGWRKDVYDD